MDIGWRFPLNNDGAITGISEAGVETFKGTPYKSLAREVCQNSLDAIKDQTKPVLVEFSSIQYFSNRLEGKEDLSDSFQRCSEFWNTQKDKKATNFFKKAYEIINKDTIHILRMSDFNTTGLDGSDKQLNSNWSNLVKSSGVSDKGASAGGSFGIGKSAPFACSDFRTVLYSTYDCNGVEASQGVARLVSFESEQGVTQGTGYYGNKERNQPVFQQLKLEEGYDRQESGTDIYILGFRQDTEWKEQIIAAVLEGFLVAIWKGLLEVKVDDVTISRETLNTVIDAYEVHIDSYTRNYYKVLMAEDTVVIQQDFEGLGEIVLYLNLDNDFHRKVCINRKSGMKIFDKDRIHGYIPFAGVLILEGMEVNKFFRPMETPQHDKWEPDRHDTPSAAKKKLTALNKMIKEAVMNLNIENGKDEIDVEGIGEYLPDETENSDAEQDKKEDLSDRVKRIEVKKVDISSTSKNLSDGEDGNDDMMEIGGTPTDSGNNPGIVNGNGGTSVGGGGKPGGFDLGGDGSTTQPVVIKPMAIRLFCSNKEESEYTLIFSLDKLLKNSYIQILMVGEQKGQKDVEAKTTSAHKITDVVQELRISNNKIILGDIQKNEKVKVRFTIDYDTYCSMEVKVHGFKA